MQVSLIFILVYDLTVIKICIAEVHCIIAYFLVSFISQGCFLHGPAA